MDKKPEPQQPAVQPCPFERIRDYPDCYEDCPDTDACPKKQPEGVILKDARGKIAPEDSSEWKCKWLDCESGGGIAGHGFCPSRGEWNNPNCPDYQEATCQPLTQCPECIWGQKRREFTAAEGAYCKYVIYERCDRCRGEGVM
jgi:hypothetical protein